MKTIVTIATFGSALLFASLAQMAIAAEHFHAHKSRHVRTVSKGICGANASIAVPVLPTVAEPAYYGGGWSAPAGH
jgi:hypothetical protein